MIAAEVSNLRDSFSSAARSQRSKSSRSGFVLAWRTSQSFVLRLVADLGFDHIQLADPAQCSGRQRRQPGSIGITELASCMRSAGGFSIVPSSHHVLKPAKC
jgi:hypothetical protein